ncbi:MAG TPA: SIMPL domain-containing protein [Flavobacteriales bacterium]|nr:SIMPL domain-containing protein [Flavobacteriales bacterium]
MKFICTVIASILFINLHSQELPAIKVTGVANMEVTPDIAVFKLHLNARNKSESLSIQDLTVVSNNVLTKLKELGYPEKEITLNDYSVVANYEYVGDKAKRNGYRATQNLTVKTRLSKEIILKTLKAFSTEDARQTYITYNSVCSDSLQKAVEKKLIEHAITDASEKATIIATSLKVKLAQVQQVFYEVNEGYGSGNGAGGVDYYATSSGKSMNEMELVNETYFTIEKETFIKSVRIDFGIEQNKP